MFVILFRLSYSPLDYTRSLHDALPSSRGAAAPPVRVLGAREHGQELRGRAEPVRRVLREEPRHDLVEQRQIGRHTSELQSPCNLVCRLLLDKKKIRAN